MDLVKLIWPAILSASFFSALISAGFSVWNSNKTIKANLKSKSRLERIDFITQKASNILSDLFIFTRPLSGIDEDYFEKLFNRIIENIFVIELNLLGNENIEIRKSLEKIKELAYKSLETKIEETKSTNVNLEYVVDPDLNEEFEHLRKLFSEYINSEWLKAEKNK